MNTSISYSDFISNNPTPTVFHLRIWKCFINKSQNTMIFLHCLLSIIFISSQIIQINRQGYWCKTQQKSSRAFAPFLPCTSPNISRSVQELLCSRMLKQPYSSGSRTETRWRSSLGHEMWHRHQEWHHMAVSGWKEWHWRQALPMWSAVAREPLLSLQFWTRGILFVFWVWFACLWELLCLVWGCVVVVRVFWVFFCLQRKTHFDKSLPEKHNISSNVALMGFL